MISNLNLETYNFNSIETKEWEMHQDLFFGEPGTFQPHTTNNVFSDQQCELIKQLGYSLNVNTATTFGGNPNGDDRIRKSKVSFLPRIEKTVWIYNILTSLVFEANKIFNYDLTGFHEKIQFAAYSEKKSHYDYHIDIHHLYPARKLSICVLLDNPDEFEGGEFSFTLGARSEQIPLVKGSAVIFPSFILHKVNPITQGKRHSLVAWIGGPNFK